MHVCTFIKDASLPISSQQQQQSSNVVVVQGQPQVVQTQYVHQRHYGSGDHGLVLAIIASLCVLFFGWWVGFVCTVPAIFIALNVSTKMKRILSVFGSLYTWTSRPECSFDL